MKHINKYYSDNDVRNILISELSPISESIALSLDYGIFEKEVDYLNEIESSLIDENTLFDIQFDMIVNEGIKSISNYYRKLALNKNELIERAKSKLSVLEQKEIEKKYNDLILKLKSTRINEQVTVPTENIASAALDQEYSNILNQTAGVDVASTEDSGGIMSMIKNLWSAITEDGSPIGILHLILDIVGLFGDAFTVIGLPIGLVADIMNGIIYLMRGKTILAIISFIAAIIPMAGDSLKLFKPGAKSMETVFKATAGSAKVSDDAYKALMKLPTKERFGAIRGLDYISKSIGGTMGKVVEIVSKFFESFLAKVSSYIPLIGGPLSKFFLRIGSRVRSFADEMTTFSKNWDEAAQLTVSKSIDDFFKGADHAISKGGKIVVEGENIVIKSANGRVMGSIPTKEITNSKVILQKYPEGPLADYFKGAGGEKIAKFYSTLAEVNVQGAKSLTGSVWKIGKRVLKLKTATILFVAKQIAKLLYTSSGEMGPSEAEAEANAIIALDNFLYNRCKSELDKNKDQIYCAPKLNTGEVTDYDAIEVITNYQNHYAESFGLPSVIHVAYVKGKDEMPAEVEEFFNQAFTEKEIKEMNELSNEYGFNKENNESLSHIISFKKFIK